MSPRANVSDPGEGGGYVDRKGEFLVRYKEIAEETMKPKSPDSPFKESLRVAFGVEGEDGTVSLSVQIEDPRDDLWGFVSDPDAAPMDDEAALRAFVEREIVKDPVTVYVSGFIQSRQAPVGPHVFERVIRIFRYQTTGRDGKPNPRLGMVAVTAEGLTASWTCPEPAMSDNRKGDGPAGDRIGPISADVHAFQYLQMFGLNWDRMKAELEDEGAALWPGHWDANGDPVPSLFPDLNDPWQGFLDMIERHGPRRVKMEIERHPQYGLGPKRLGKGLVKMTEIEGGGGLSPEFEREKAVFLEVWDNLTKVLLGKDDARFLAGGKFTDEGKEIAKSVLAPLVRRWPEGMRKHRADGSPEIHLPPTEVTWKLNALVAANVTAEKLMRMSEEERFVTVSLTDPASLLAWAEGAVPEWSGAGKEESEGELL